MKKLILIFLFILFLPMLALSAWIDANSKPIAETESMQSNGDFGVHLVLTPDDNQFRKIWNATKGTSELRATNSIRVGSQIAAMLIFHGCTPNTAGVCDVVSEFILENPDGTKTPAGGGPVWSDKPPQRGMLQLGLANLKIGFDSKDPLGNYKVIVNVKDRISGSFLTLTAGFKLTK
jgi:hypothetical protein